MILILSNALATRWKIKLVPLDDLSSCHPAFVWRADSFRVGRTRSNILCVNEASCFSLVLLDQKQMSFKKTLLDILSRIGNTLQAAGMPDARIREGLSEVVFVKHRNPQVSGTMTDQKFRYEWSLLDLHPSITSVNMLEYWNNRAPLGTFKMKSSAEVFAETVHTAWAPRRSGMACRRPRVATWGARIEEKTL